MSDTPDKIAAERWLKENRKRFISYKHHPALNEGEDWDEAILDEAAMLAAYAQGPRDDAGVLEWRFKKLLNWAVDIAHCGHDGSREDCQWPICKETRELLAESAMPQPQSKWDAYMREHGREEYGLTHQLCAECHKPIALRHVMEGDGTHKAVPESEVMPTEPGASNTGMSATEASSQTTMCSADIGKVATVELAPQPTAEGPKCPTCNGIRRVKKPDGLGSMTCPDCSRPTPAPAAEPAPAECKHENTKLIPGKGIVCAACGVHEVNFPLVKNESPAPETLSAEVSLARKIVDIAHRSSKNSKELEWAIVDILKTASPSGAEERPRCPKCGNEDIRFDGEFVTCVHCAAHIQVLTPKDFAQFFPAPAESEAVRALQGDCSIRARPRR